MVQVNELRIGNFLYNQNNRMIEINFQELQAIYLKRGIYNSIPISEKILIKFGFVRHNEGDYWLNMWNETYFGISQCLVKSAEFLETGKWYYSDNFIEIKYLHQLQNLHFALTGKEISAIP